MTKSQIAALYEDITNWTNNKPQNTVCPNLLINGHYRILSIYEFRAHYKNHTCDHYMIEFWKGNQIMFSIHLADNKLIKIYFIISRDFHDNIQLRIENDMLRIYDNKFKEGFLLETMDDAYEYLRGCSINDYFHSIYTTNNYFHSIPLLVSLQQALDDINPKVEKEIVIEI